MLIEPEDDGEEHFVDADEEGKTSKAAETSITGASTNGYDGRKRAPQFAHAETSCLWELVSGEISQIRFG